MKNIFRLFIASLLCLALSGCSGGDNNASKEPTATIGSSAPAFALKTVDGRDLTLESFRGKPLVLTFMAEWCPCSNKSAPVFKEAYAEFNPKGVEFAMLGFQDSRSKFGEFVKRQALPFPAAYDEGDEVGTSYGVVAPPTTFFITPDGKIQRAFYGKIEERDKLFAWVDELLSKSSVPADAKANGGPEGAEKPAEDGKAADS